MNRITRVDLAGFKGQERTYELGKRNVLSGPNGLGKSAVLESVRFALSGDVPAGRSHDEVAKYFPPRGGSVVLTDDAGNWIERRVVRDHEKAKVSVEVETHGKADWSANEALLDMRSFLALSPNKRREFVLELVGAGEAPDEQEIHQRLSHEYARQIGGPGANARILDGKWEELPDEIRPLAKKWLTCWGVVSSYLRTGETTASATFQRLADAAKERKNGSRRAATEAKAAIRELEAAAKGARAAAAEVEKRREGVGAAVEELSKAREESARREEVQAALVAALEEVDDASKLCESAEKAVADLRDPGESPPFSNDASDDDEEAERLKEVRRNVRDARKERETMVALIRDREAHENAIDAEKLFLKDLKEERIVKALALADSIRSREWFELGSEVSKLCDIVDDLGAERRKKRARLEERIDEKQSGLAQLRERINLFEHECPSAEALAQLETELAELELEAESRTRARAERKKAEVEAYKRWQDGHARADTARSELKSAQGRYEAAASRASLLETKLADMPAPPLQALREDVDAAKEALQLAEEAAGAVQAYEDAVLRAEREKVAEAAWKALEAACRRCRETYVAEVVRPLVRDMAQLLADAGRNEVVYLELENDRGKPIFDLGWAATDGAKRSLSALSGGESALFTTALALTIARRSEGRRVLLIEADPLDEKNLGELLTAIGKVPGDLFELCLVATSTDIGMVDPVSLETWSVGTFHDDGQVVVHEAATAEPKGA